MQRVCFKENQPKRENTARLKESRGLPFSIAPIERPTAMYRRLAVPNDSERVFNLSLPSCDGALMAH
jgi:hypothetical protein